MSKENDNNIGRKCSIKRTKKLDRELEKREKETGKTKQELVREALSLYAIPVTPETH